MFGELLSEGLPREKRHRPATFIVYGASGDLARRKLFPALFTLFREGYIDELKIVGFARRDWDDAAFRKVVEEALIEANPSEEEKEQFLPLCTYIESSFDTEAGYKKIKEIAPPQHELIHYLATAPEYFATIAESLKRHGLSSRELAFAASRIVIEKPFGKNGKEAAILNKIFQKAFHESDIYRIDHYLGKESAQNIQVFRFGNRIFEPIWNNQHIRYVEITVAETVGVGERGPYYEESGALLDMVQNHLLQLLSLIAMDAPANLAADTIRDEKVRVLRSLRPLEGKAVAAQTLRAQYKEGIVDSRRVPAYRSEARVNSSSETETWAGLVAYIDNWRWAGVPFLLRTGKRLSRRLSEIVIHFHKPPLSLFPSSFSEGNQLVFRIQSEEGITLFLDTKIPGLERQTRTVSMDFLYGTGSVQAEAEAYERLILDLLLADSSLYTRADEVALSWAFIDPIRKAWKAGNPPLAFYSAGSSGPREAQELAARHGASWRRL